jgi:stage II sporulation protein AB (anti-sigma F factor)
MKNAMRLEFQSKSSNESFARATVAAFVSQLDPTLEEISDIKTALSEAVTNAIVHGYEDCEGVVTIACDIDGGEVTVTVSDSGKGIADLQKAMEPLYTSRPEMERSGMGFTVMETFMDGIQVRSAPGAGTDVTMTKIIKNG